MALPVLNRLDYYNNIIQHNINPTSCHLVVAVSSLDWQQAEVNPICIQYNVIVVLVYYGLQSMTV